MNENYLIPKLKSFKIKMKGIEPVFFITYKTSPRATIHLTKGLFNPIHSLVRKFKLRMQYYDFKKLGIEPEQCECCGEGWATWMIDEPNGENYSVTCCDGCVDFYDWKLSRKKIKYSKLLNKK